MLIRLTDVRVPLSIGWSEQERRTPQPIRFDVEIALATPPRAITTDALRDTVDYAAIAALIRNIAGAKPVRLLERLAGEVAEAIRAELPPGARLRLRVTKQLPEITGGHGSAAIELVTGDGRGR